MNISKVKWFNNRKGFGFVTHPDGRDVFVHYSVIKGQAGFKSLAEDQLVQYAIEETDKGLRALSVELIKAPGE